MFAPGATPPVPAAMPATWEPWSHMFTVPARHFGVVASAAAPSVCLFCPFGQSDSTPASSVAEKHACATMRPANHGWSGSMPVSSTATAWPAPVKLFACAWSAPISDRLGVTSAGRYVRSRWMEETRGSSASLASSSAVPSTTMNDWLSGCSTTSTFSAAAWVATGAFSAGSVSSTMARSVPPSTPKPASTLLSGPDGSSVGVVSAGGASAGGVSAGVVSAGGGSSAGGVGVWDVPGVGMSVGSSA